MTRYGCLLSAEESSPHRLLEQARLAEQAEAGFDRVYVNRIGSGQQGFFDFYRSEILPRLSG